MIVVGIDPGLSGALVAIDGSTIVSVLDMPTVKVRTKNRVEGYAITRWLIELGPVEQVVVEDVGSRPGEGPSMAFNFGHGVGTLHGILVALERPWSVVHAQTWTKGLGVAPDKDARRYEAQRQFPVHSDLFTRKKDNGRADAALIALWWAGARRAAA